MANFRRHEREREREGETRERERDKREGAEVNSYLALEGEAG